MDGGQIAPASSRAADVEDPMRNEFLVDWDALDEGTKDIDRNLIKGIPRILARPATPSKDPQIKGSGLGASVLPFRIASESPDTALSGIRRGISAAVREALAHRIWEFFDRPIPPRRRYVL